MLVPTPRATLDSFVGMRVRGIGNAFAAVGAEHDDHLRGLSGDASRGIGAAAFARHAPLSFGTINEADW
ncbi:hypothetical protein KO516_17980 [Citreicella sp. C3M06]|uniref:hypothetical protein n=1 Tax=Citreicella sp. C3M06 TaxID=2841564 RepID=UPI001C0A3BE0|nr:hypothetical protein [Citreicella sp. C3M06]MBU2962680.1 hypothetical protein [Citreicella sp. C3M06]